MASENLDHARAAYAWKCVNEGVNNGNLEKYANLAKGAPALIMNNGLMQTLAFYKSKEPQDGKRDHHAYLGKHIRGWLAKLPGLGFRPEAGDRAGFKNAMETLCKMEPSTYRRATTEALALLRWIRQFAAAVQKGG